MIQKIFLTILLFLFCTTQAWAISSSLAKKNPFIEKTLALPYFDSMRIMGDIDVQITAGSWGPRVKVSGCYNNVQALKTYVKGATLWVVSSGQKKSCARLRLEIHLPLLSCISCNGRNSRVSINGLQSSDPVNMAFAGNPIINIKGHIRLCSLVASGNSQVLAYWVDACEPYIRATDNARICISGVADTLEIDACQSSWVNARYLPVRRAFVKSYNCARVDVRPTKSLNAFASQRSYIYYYVDPKFQAAYLEAGGSVVQMADICYPPCDLCDHACCKNDWH